MILLDQIAFGPARKPYQRVVLNPDLQIRGGHPDPEIRGEPQSQKKFYSAPRASVWSNNNKGGGGGPSSPGSTTRYSFDLFTHKNGAFGVISVTEQSCAVLCQSLK